MLGLHLVCNSSSMTMHHCWVTLGYFRCWTLDITTDCTRRIITSLVSTMLRRIRSLQCKRSFTSLSSRQYVNVVESDIVALALGVSMLRQLYMQFRDGASQTVSDWKWLFWLLTGCGRTWSGSPDTGEAVADYWSTKRRHVTCVTS